MLSTTDKDFDSQFKLLLERELQDEQQVASVVREIVRSVRSGGDASLLRYTNELDRRQESSVADLEVFDFEEALLGLDKSLKQSLMTAADRIKSYHEKQKMSSWEFKDDMGNSLGQRVIPIERAGVYVPGGKASYPSSVLMNVIPAKVAGVSEIIMVVPSPDGFVEDVVLAAAAIAGVDKVFTIGGAQAVAALAFGTETIPRVDKIVGPGNIFVAKAKAMLFGEVGIDMIAGPSEILVIC
ncbi:MAG: histidinol dehydrogenase, partial [Proteobacteria bacterium]|nr:histidinol dehydrogenase [Pseudomonadota bacterium]